MAAVGVGEVELAISSQRHGEAVAKVAQPIHRLGGPGALGDVPLGLALPLAGIWQEEEKSGEKEAAGHGRIVGGPRISSLPSLSSVKDLVGNTPLIKLGLAPAGREVLGKCEFLNPGGSVKDRIGFFMIERALERGDLRPGGLVVEPTAGNTGVALAMATAALGMRFVAVMPERFSEEKAVCVRGMGGEVVRTPSDDGMIGAIAKAHEIAADEGGWCPQQFANPDNPLAHYQTTGPEIWEQCGGRLDAFAAGVGSAGTFVGAGRYLREVCPEILLVAVQPQGSVLCGGEPGPHKVEGIGVADKAQIACWDDSLPDVVETVNDKEAHAMTQRLGREEGLLLGASSGALVEAAVRVAATLGEGARVATLLPDGGERYLGKGLYGEFSQWER